VHLAGIVSVPRSLALNHLGDGEDPRAFARGRDAIEIKANLVFDDEIAINLIEEIMCHSGRPPISELRANILVVKIGPCGQDPSIRLEVAVSIARAIFEKTVENDPD
jgi:hypothetical protein